MYIDANLENLWLGSADHEKLTPLRHWELDEKYQVSRSARISKAETRRYGGNIVSESFIV